MHSGWHAIAAAGAALLLGVGTTHAAGAQLLSKAAPLRFLALGDSITAGEVGDGSPAAGGYRGILLHALEHDGYHVSFVGSRTDFNGDLPNTPHEGWPGFVIRSFPSAPAPEIYGAITSRALKAFHPDALLLMIGTNDLLRNGIGVHEYTLPRMNEGYDLLLAQIFAMEPNIIVVAAGVVSSPRIDARTIAAFNTNVASLVRKYAAHGYRISFADRMESSLPRDTEHFPDGVHPSAAGYAAIAQAWHHAIHSITTPAREAH